MSKSNLNFIARTLLKVNSKSIKTNCFFDHRIPSDTNEELFLSTAQHISHSVDLMCKTDKDTFEILRDNLVTIFYFPGHDYSLEYFNNGRLLCLSFPYYFPFDDDTEWYEGLSACLLARIAFIGELYEIQNNEKKTQDGKAKTKLDYAYDRERSFASKLGDSWRVLYDTDEFKKMPLIAPGGW